MTQPALLLMPKTADLPQDRTDTLRLRDTYQGYAISHVPGDFDIGAVADRALRFLGMVVILCACATWLLPAGFFSGHVIVTKTVLSMVLMAVGGCIYAMGSTARAPEVQIDLSRRELRFCARCSRGGICTLRVLPMAAIKEVVLRQKEGATGGAELLVRVARSERLVSVATGPDGLIMHLHKRLSHDIQLPSERVEARISAIPVFKTTRVAA